MDAPHPIVSTRRDARRPVLLPSLALLTLLLAAPEARSFPELPEARFGLAAQRVAELLETKHLDAAPLDDARSRLFFDRFLEVLDPSRLYFLESDVEEFASARDLLDDRLHAGDVGFAVEVFTRFAGRVEERLALVRELVHAPLDFDADEYIAADRRHAPRARTMAEMRELWRRRVKLELLERTAAGASLDVARREVLARHEELARNMRAITTPELVETYLTALAATYDPHSAYLRPESVEEFDINMRLELEGIGAMLGSVDGGIVVKELVTGGAAERDGRLRAGDRIVGVSEGEGGAVADVTAMRLADVIRRIRGKRGTTVRLDVLHEGGAAEAIVLQRARIEIQDRAAQGEVIRREAAGTALAVGVITLPSFYRDFAAFGKGAEEARSSSRDLRALLEGFRRQSVDVVVIDLRRNAGGALLEAVQVTGLFIDVGPVTQIKGPGDEVETESDTEAGEAWDGPLVVLTSRFTASAAEIFAGAIQDHGRGLVVGDRTTHGKGTVQTLVPLGAEGGDDKSALGTLKLTVSQFYRPLGQSTHGLGVTPDIELPSLSSHEGGEEDLGSRVRLDRIPALHFERQDLAAPDVVAALRRRSEARTEASEEFTRIRRDIARHLESRSRRWVPLSREKFVAELGPPPGAPVEAKSPALRADLKLEPSAARGGRIAVDAYLSEVLEIASDYASLSPRKP
jgi:carboxyl-terminal processing protease